MNPIDPPVTVSRNHITIPGESVIIFGSPGNDAEESVNPFMKSKRIAGNPKSIFAKIKNQNDLSVNRFSNLENIFFVPKNQFPGNNLQEAVNQLNFLGNILKIHGNILKDESINGMIVGNKLKNHQNVLKEAGNQLKEEEINLKF